MPDDGKIHISLPSAEAATAERMAESFRQFARDPVAASFPAPFLAEALRAAAAEAEGLAYKGPDADAIIAPANTPWLDRSPRAGFITAFPRGGDRRREKWKVLE